MDGLLKYRYYLYIALLGGALMWYTARAYDELSQTDLYTPPHLVEQYHSEPQADKQYSGTLFATSWLTNAQSSYGTLGSSQGIDTGVPALPHLYWDTVSLKESGKLPNGSDKNVDIEYPKFRGDAPVTDLNTFIATLVQKKLNDDRAYALAQKIPTYYVDGNPNAPVQYFSEGMLDLGVRYVVTGARNGVVSIELVFVSYTGGGNGAHEEPITINWDLRANRKLAPQELFCNSQYVAKLKPLATQKLIDDYQGSAGGKKYWVDNVKRGLDDQDIWENFILTNDGLAVIFPAYAVGPSTYRAKISNEDLKGILCIP